MTDLAAPDGDSEGAALASHLGDSRLQDVEALDEIALYGELLAAVSQSDGPLPEDAIDKALGLR
ncbi:MAG: hypothetical protein ACTHMZ_06125 [Actinomycetes bacterium]